MKTAELAKELELTKLTSKDEDKEISGVYIGDLLSVVMNNCEAGNLWITSQTHMNILNVADMNEVAGVIFAGGAKADESLIEKADDLGVALFATDKAAYELAWNIHEVL